MSASLRRDVLAGYRHLIKSNKLLFGKDAEGVRAGLLEIRTQFRANKDLAAAEEISAYSRVTRRSILLSLVVGAQK